MRLVLQPDFEHKQDGVKSVLLRLENLSEKTINEVDLSAVTNLLYLKAKQAQSFNSVLKLNTSELVGEIAVIETNLQGTQLQETTSHKIDKTNGNLNRN